ncbi:hypothetical protein [Methylobacterium sp. WL64]|uniref:hypothetical protein n=1 Tax=Methylobacterium sp. WL64 TaxID=2603894 RepID=UPI0016503C1E|nr:hypothetical protein [Methylobacterium sp. WL64]
MDTDHLRSGLARLASDLNLAGEPIALDVVVARHLPLLSEARAARLRWSSLARLVAEAGARRPDGSAISADQLRASYSRAARHCLRVQPAPVERTEAKVRATRHLPSVGFVERFAMAPSEPTIAGDVEPSGKRRPEKSDRTTDPEPTDTELASVRARLR